ncbi:MAG: orotidine 5'-phosphate decarboxylase / HUMPS family protein [Janthinobacterium lividum]
MSSADNLFSPSYTKRCVELARDHKDFVLGFIAQESLNSAAGDNFIVMTPGVNLPPAPATPSLVNGRSSGAARLQTRSAAGSRQSQHARPVTPKTSSKASTGDGMGQQYNTPRHVVLEKGVDIIIVGRGILNADDRGAEAERYRKEGWGAVLERCGGKA